MYIIAHPYLIIMHAWIFHSNIAGYTGTWNLSWAHYIMKTISVFKLLHQSINI